MNPSPRNAASNARQDKTSSRRLTLYLAISKVEHNIKASSAPRRKRQVDMSTFNSHLHSISSSNPASSSATDPIEAALQQHQQQHNNPHATANPVDMAALFRLVQDQVATLLADAPDDANRDLLRAMAESLEDDIARPPREVPGVSQEYLDSLERVARGRLGAEDACPICAERYLDDRYCLVVELPCHASHRFDLECVAPWLQSKGTCPLCRKDLTKKKEVAVPQDDDEEEDDGGMYA